MMSIVLNEKQRHSYGKAQDAKYRAATWSKIETLVAFNAASYFPRLSPANYRHSVRALGRGRYLLCHSAQRPVQRASLRCVGRASDAGRRFGEPAVLVGDGAMTLSLFASSSADGLVICAAPASASVSELRIGRSVRPDEATMSGFHWLVIGLCSVCLVATKISYLPLALQSRSGPPRAARSPLLFMCG